MKTKLLGWAIVALAIFIIPGGTHGADLVAGEGFIDLENGQVWYRIVGSGSATPLLVLHGGPGVPGYYLKPLATLAAERPVVFYHQLGCGNSSATSDSSLWTIEYFVEELAQVRKALGLDSVHLYGHSWGTMLAVDYMLTKPEGVRSLILAGAVLSIPRYRADCDNLLGTLGDSVQAMMHSHELAGTMASSEYNETLILYYQQFLARKLPWSVDMDSVFAGINHRLSNHMIGETRFIPSGTLQSYDRTSRLHEIMVPTLFTAGEYDESTPATVEYYRSLVPGAQIAILKNCGHLTTQDDPDGEVGNVRSFLKQVEAE